MPFEADTLPPLPREAPPALPDHHCFEYAFEGHVDFYGYHAAAQGWFFGGWIAHPWPIGNRPRNVIAQFAHTNIVEHTLSAFYHRADVERRGIGFVFLLRTPQADPGAFVRLIVEFTRTTHEVNPTPGVLHLPDAALTAELRPLLAGGEAGSQRRRMLDLLRPAGPGGEAAGGFVDSYGYHTSAGGWVFSGWAAHGWTDAQPPTRLLAAFEEGDIEGEAVAVRYPRPDLKDGGEGTLFFVPGSGVPLGSLCSVSYEAGGVRTTLFPGAMVQRLREGELVARHRPVLAQAPPAPARENLLALLARQPYAGEDTLAALSDPVLLEIDEAIVCEPDGLVLIGWCLAKPGAIRDIRVHCGLRATSLDLSRAVAVERPDVLEAIGAERGFEDAGCGFVAFLPQAAAANTRLYFEVETARREIGFRAIPAPRLTGMPAIRRILACVDARFGDLPRAFDRVLGPAVEMLNRRRLAQRPGSIVADYGTPPAKPRYSVIVPLYGRLNYVEYQLALFSAHPGAREVEFIYVLDDPGRRREAQSLFAAAYECFGIPCRTVLLDRNVGFAPACNIGLEHATGTFVAYVNSDVFPGTPDWLDRLAAHLEADPALGVVGPVLLFEDGSVQHRGMDFVRQREFGDWFFPIHGGKGMRRGKGRGLQPSLSITGACMLMRRALARTAGGFDEIYAIGDFEDSDLCLKLRALGYSCAVDESVELYHLERRSQASSALGWRMNLTLYNAWQHERRWGTTIAAQQQLGATPRAGGGRVARRAAAC